MPLTLDPSLRDLPAALAGEFELEQEIGRGGMGVVFRARDTKLDRPVALKVLPPALGGDADIRARFLREARTAGQLSHPHIVAIYRADERNGFAFFAMALVDGETLGSRVKDRGPLPAGDVVRHLREVAWGLAYAHARGVIHRDIKPDNIMIERGTNRALVTDFGIARTERAPGLTAEGHVLGTAHFMSPEQIQGATLDGRSDLYSLGVVGYYLLSGKLPFEGTVSSAVLVAHVTQRAPALASVAPTVPARLAAIIDRCLAKDPADRFASGEALEEALASALEGADVSPAVSGGQHAVLSEAQAAAVWRRAAQLQAEAAARLERQSRASATRLPSDGAAAGDHPTGPGAVPTASYRAKDVEAAAVEAGISQRFVALAMSELPSALDAVVLDPAEPSGTSRFGKALLGSLQRSLSVSRIIRASPRETLQALGRAFQGAPYQLRLKEQIGPHPLDGGILVFRLPEVDWSGQSATSPLIYTSHGLFAREMRVTLRPLEHDRGACEVTVYVDARPGLGKNVWMYGGLSFGATATTVSVGSVFASQALAIAGAMLAASAGVIALAAGALAVGGSRATYRWCIRKATNEIEELLLSIDATLRSRSIFEGDPLAPALPRPSEHDPQGDRDW